MGEVQQRENKETQHTTEKVQLVEPVVNVVTYDEEQTVQAVAVDVEPIDEAHNAYNTYNPGFPESTQVSASAYPARPQPATASPSGVGVECLLCGDTKLRHISPGTTFSLSLCGNTFIDISEVSFPPNSKITLMSVRLCGNVILVVPKNTQVTIRRITLCGNRDINVEQEIESDPLNPPPSLTVNIISLCGNIVVTSDPEEFEGGPALTFR